jgi:putative transposase
MPSRRSVGGLGMDWARVLAYVTGTVDQELLARNEYLAAENRILKAELTSRLKLLDSERGTLGEIGYGLGRKSLADVAIIARPDTILGWYRKLIARKFDGSKVRRRPGKPRIKREVEQLIIRMASENRDWGYDRIAGALANLGDAISDQTRQRAVALRSKYPKKYPGRGPKIAWEKTSVGRCKPSANCGPSTLSH